ncbi:hypothetical protein ACH4VM_36685 [Streptomyces sp. NPDC020792]
MLAWFAMASFNQLLAGQPWTDELHRIATEAGINDLAAFTPRQP